jgi:hypothetical protein
MTTRQFWFRPAMESIFLSIAREAVEEAEQNELTKATSVEAHIQMQHSSITAIIGSAMAAEAFINVVAEQRLSANVWRAVEKLNVVEKWVVVTKLLRDKEWDKGSQPFQDFAALLVSRESD